MMKDAHDTNPPINRILCTDALSGLRGLPDACIDCVITSPPYWGLRDYGDACQLVWDGDPRCRHRWLVNKKHRSSTCRTCGAWRGQLGLEPTIRLYVRHLVSIFAEIKRVLKPGGTCWLNLGDTYGGSWGNESHRSHPKARSWPRASAIAPDRASPPARSKEVPPKCLGLVPERVVLALIEQGWILRNKIIWHKPNHMPESVKDRLTRSWEYLYLLVKSPRYDFNLDAIRIPHKTKPISLLQAPSARASPSVSGRRLPPHRGPGALHPKGRNPAEFWSIEGETAPSDAWSLSTRIAGERRPPPVAPSVRHYASFPEAFCERPIRAGCAPGGVVLDPFVGTGTVAVAAKRLGRHYLGFEPNPDYVRAARLRLEHTNPQLKGGEP